MSRGNRLADGQAKTQPIVFRGGERLEQAPGNVGGYPGAIVADADQDIGWPARTLRRETNMPSAHLHSQNRVDRIANQVEQDLLELATIRTKRWKVVLDHDFNADVRRGGLLPHEYENILQ